MKKTDYKRKRKPRGKKLNGERSQDMCPHCISFGCDPMSMSYKFRHKIDRRLKNGLCPACGHKPCSCKSKL